MFSAAASPLTIFADPPRFPEFLRTAAERSAAPNAHFQSNAEVVLGADAGPSSVDTPKAVP